jgi:glyoxylase-like metal-dependent hydrolase (beta-lactamase superfamily II)
MTLPQAQDTRLASPRRPDIVPSMPLRPSVYAFDFGGFRIATLLDATDIRGGLAESFALGEPEDHVREIAAANFIDSDRFEHPFIPVFVDTGKAKVLFDTGLGEPESALLHGLTQLGVAAADIDIVVLTHGHPDHIGGLMTDGTPTFPRARYVFGAAEFEFWRRGENVREARHANRELFMRNCAPLADRAIFVAPGDEILPGITAVDAAGHSPGLLAWRIEHRPEKCVRFSDKPMRKNKEIERRGDSNGTPGALENADRRLLIWSDTCLHYIVSLQRPDWQANVDDDKEAAARTRRRLLTWAADEQIVVAGYHMPFPGLGFVEHTDDAFRWVPVSYQLNL